MASRNTTAGVKLSSTNRLLKLLSISCKSLEQNFKVSNLHLMQNCKCGIEMMVEVTLKKVNHGKLKFTIVNNTASVTPIFQFTMVNLTLVSCPDNSGKNKVDLNPDYDLVMYRKKR